MDCRIAALACGMAAIRRRRRTGALNPLPEGGSFNTLGACPHRRILARGSVFNAQNYGGILPRSGNRHGGGGANREVRGFQGNLFADTPPYKGGACRLLYNISAGLDKKRLSRSFYILSYGTADYLDNRAKRYRGS